MRLSLVFIKILLFLYSTILLAQTQSNEKYEYLWKIKKEGSKNEVYFAGTAHYPTSEKNHPVLMKVLNTIQFEFYSGELDYDAEGKTEEETKATAYKNNLYRFFLVIIMKKRENVLASIPKSQLLSEIIRD